MKADFDKQQLIMDIAFQPTYVSRAINKPPKGMYVVYSYTVYVSLLYSDHWLFHQQNVKWFGRYN